MITLTDQIAEAQRELALRKLAYPKQVKRGTLTEGQAAYHIAAMQAIIVTLRQLDMDQRQLHLFREVARP
jgi:hypothetical protein